MIVRKRLRITGRVQGVGFRASTVATARALGLVDGWPIGPTPASRRLPRVTTQRLQRSSAGAIMGHLQRVSTRRSER